MFRLREVCVRAAFFGCGLVSILIARMDHILDLFFPANRHAWTAIASVLKIAGVINVVVTIAPQRWIRPLFGNVETRWLRLPFWTFTGFFVMSYAVVAVLSVLPPGTVPSPLTAYILCPSCFNYHR